MKIQSLSVVVPTNGCINKCKFCVSRMRKECYKNQMDDNLPFYDLYEKDYIKRLEFARDNGCNTVMLTGNGEPQQNRTFLAKFGSLNRELSTPFRWIEIQTTGALIDDSYLRFLRNHVGVSTISISLSSLNDTVNRSYNGATDKTFVDIEKLCHSIKKYDFNLRLSLNLTDWYNNFTYKNILDMCKQLGADQVTFRKLYLSGDNTEQDMWISTHAADGDFIDGLRKYLSTFANKLEILPYGARKYSIFGMGVVFDEDCMSEELKNTYKYLILRPNCKLYSKWDDPASLIF